MIRGKGRIEMDCFLAMFDVLRFKALREKLGTKGLFCKYKEFIFLLEVLIAQAGLNEDCKNKIKYKIFLDTIEFEKWAITNNR